MLIFLIATAFLIVYFGVISPKTSILLWLFAFLIFEHFGYLIPGLPLLTLNSLTVIPLFAIHFFTKRLHQGWNRIPKHILVPLALVLLFQTVQLFRSEHAITQVIQVFLGREIYPVLMLLMAATLDWRKEEIARAAGVGLFALALGSAVAMYEHFSLIPVFSSTDDPVLELFPHRPTGLFSTVANLCSISSLGLLYYMPNFVKQKGPMERLIVIIMVAATMYAAYLANYRGTLVPMLALAFGYLLLEKKRRLPVVLLVVAMTGVLAAEWSQLTQTKIYENRLAEQGSSRVATYIHSFKVISHRPIFGAGFENVTYVMEEETPTYYEGSVSRNTPHNAVLWFLLEGGFIGLAVFTLFYFGLVASLIAKTKELLVQFGRDFAYIPIMIFALYAFINVTQTSYNATVNVYVYFVLGQFLSLRPLENPAFQV